MRWNRSILVITGSVVHLWLLLSWCQHFKLQSLWPPLVEPVEGSANLKGIQYQEPMPLEPSLFPWQRHRKQMNVTLIQVPQRRDMNTVDRLFAEPRVLNPGYDFFQLYWAGLALANGISIYENVTGAYEQSVRDYLNFRVPFHHPFRYFPWIALAVGMPLNALSPWNAYILWILLIEVIFGLSVYLTCQWFDGPHVLVGAMMWFFFLPYYLDLYLGQTSFLLGFLIFIVLMEFARLTEHRYPLVSAAGFTLGALIKPVPLYFAPVFILRRRWRLLIVPPLILALTSLAYFLLHPADSGLFLGWLFGSKPLPSLNLPGFLGYMLPAWMIRILSLGILVLSLDVTLRHRSRILLLAGVWLSTYFLTYTHVWEHHYAMLLPLLVILYIRTGSPVILAIFVLIALPSPYLLIDPGAGPLHKMLIRAPKTAATIWLYGWLLGKCRSRRLDDAMTFDYVEAPIPPV
ncbi:DUF2029 domain-containing protein [bacterium]|nr:DUF2029 domain-containing protein [candidate division CSSED10-310 bacterium]